MKQSLTSYKKLFLDYLLSVKKASPLTIKTYHSALEEMILYAEIVEEKNQTTLFLMPYRQHIAKQNKKTITKKLSACRSFISYINEIHEEKCILKDDTPIKVHTSLPKPIEHHHILEALSQANSEEKVLVLMLYALGVRISELSSLRLSDIKDRWIRVLGKGGKVRDIPLNQGLKKAMDDYCVSMQPKKFFFEKNAQKLSEDSLRYKLNKIFKRIGIKVTPHQLRHSYATGLLNGGARIEDVSELLGHESIATTQIYTKLASNLKMKHYEQAHPLEQKGK